MPITEECNRCAFNLVKTMTTFHITLEMLDTLDERIKAAYELEKIFPGAEWLAVPEKAAFLSIALPSGQIPSIEGDIERLEKICNIPLPKASQATKETTELYKTLLEEPDVVQQASIPSLKAQVEKIIEALSDDLLTPLLNKGG